LKFTNSEKYYQKCEIRKKSLHSVGPASAHRPNTAGPAHNHNRPGGHAHGAQRAHVVSGHRAAGAGAGATTGDDTEAPVECGQRCEHEGSTANAPSNRRGGEAHPFGGTMTRQRGGLQRWCSLTGFQCGEGALVSLLDGMRSGAEREVPHKLL
jgi:hypothetical protein